MTNTTSIPRPYHHHYRYAQQHPQRARNMPDASWPSPTMLEYVFLFLFSFLLLISLFYDDYDSTMPPSWSQPPIFTTRHSLPCGKFFLVSFLLMIIFLYYDNSESDYDSTSWLWLMIGAMTTIAPCPHHDHNHPYSRRIARYPVVSFFLFHFF